MTRKTAVVICPGRGVYNKAELGYLSRNHADRHEMFSAFDRQRAELGQETLAALDGAPSFAMATHTRGDNASALIFAGSLADFQAIDRGKIDIVAVTGNSMGWYSALACGGAVSPENGFRVANTMGTLMQQSLIGGQLIYPFIGEDWVPAPDRKAELLAIAERTGVSLSIDLGGLLVLAGDKAGLEAFEKAVPVVQERFPMRLANHAAFHTDLQAPVAEAGRERLPASLFGQPKVPLIDGRGAIWWPDATDRDALRAYTLGHQVTESYDFTRAIQVAAREFAPDYFIVTGPGTTLGGAVAQSLILAGWRGMGSKADFQARQKETSLLISMGMEEQRSFVVGSSS